MGHESYQIKPGVASGSKIGDHLNRRGIGKTRTRREVVDALDEKSSVVDVKRPLVHANGAKPDPTLSMVIDLTVDVEFTTKVVQRLVAKRMRPPQFGFGNVDRPFDSVLASCGGVVELLGVARDGSTEGDHAAFRVIEDTAEG